MKAAVLIVVLVLGTCTEMVAQKRLSRTFSNPEINGIYIHSNEIFEIRLRAASVKEITLSTLIEGETFESALLNVALEGKILNITTGRTPDFEPFNDKLSAHKVLSIVVEITVPEGLDVDIYSTLAQVDGSGTFGNVQMNLGRGGCRMEEFRFDKSAKINTITGAIHLVTPQTAVTAQSRNGTIVISKEFAQGEALMLQSIHGDITVRSLE